MHSIAEERELVMTDDRSQPPTKELATAAHRTRVVFLAARCAVGRGDNVVRLCFLHCICCLQ